jgi:N-hydroxyarylamine O-acetyltransferase
MRTVPFENFDIHLRREIVLNEEELFAKIVDRRRGGICYELNGLFALLLREIGFNVAMLSAQVYNSDGQLSPDFDHLTLLVEIDQQRYLVDVGFGDSFLYPLELKRRDVQVVDRESYQLLENGMFFTLARINSVDGAKVAQPMFRFDLTPHTLTDFAQRCNFHQESLESNFRRKVICSRATSDGRITISGSQLIVTEGPARLVTELSGARDVEKALNDHFGLSL